MTDYKAQVVQTWKSYKATEKHGIAFGEALIAYRDNCKRGEFLPTLEVLKIPNSTAYWWMNRADPKKPKKTKRSEVAKLRRHLYDATRGLGVEDLNRIQQFIKLSDDQRKIALAYIKALAHQLVPQDVTAENTKLSPMDANAFGDAPKATGAGAGA